MNFQDYVEKMKKVQTSLLTFIEKGDNEEENYENLRTIIDDQKIKANKHELKTLLHIINQISNNHHRYPNFYKKIEQIISILTNEIQQYYTNYEIYEIFNENKRILLYLIKENIITIDDDIFQEMMEINNQLKNYPEYFAPEIKPFIEKAMKQKDSNNEKPISNIETIYENIQEILKEETAIFNQKRSKGENDKFICELIQNDSIDEFISYVNKNDYSLKSYVEDSIFETNSMLLTTESTIEKVKLIEYVAFFGSIQIFKYLYKNNVSLDPSIWIYAIHGDNEEMIHLLEEEKIGFNGQNEPEVEEEYGEYEEEEERFFLSKNDLYQEYFKESIKCHNIDFSNYFQQFFKRNKKFQKNVLPSIFQYYNFLYFPEEIDDKSLFLYSCKYDYYIIVENLLETKKIKVKTMIIKNTIFF